MLLNTSRVGHFSPNIYEEKKSQKLFKDQLMYKPKRKEPNFVVRSETKFRPEIVNIYANM